MSLLISPDALKRRRRLVADVPGLRALRDHLRGDLEPLLVRPVCVTEAKALLSRHGAVCEYGGRAY